MDVLQRSFPRRRMGAYGAFFNNGKLKFDDSLIFKKLPMKDAKEAFDMYKTPGKVKGKILLVND